MCVYRYLFYSASICVSQIWSKLSNVPRFEILRVKMWKWRVLNCNAEFIINIMFALSGQKHSFGKCNSMYGPVAAVTNTSNVIKLPIHLILHLFSSNCFFYLLSLDTSTIFLPFFTTLDFLIFKTFSYKIIINLVHICMLFTYVLTDCIF